MTERVCYFGAYDLQYPRNAVNRLGLRTVGAEVFECRVDVHHRTARRAAGLIAQFRRLPRPTVIVVAEFNHTLMPIARLLANRSGAACLFDPYVSMWEINVKARATVRAGSPRARYLHSLDRAAFNWPDRLIWETTAQRSFFLRAYDLSPERVGVVWPGVDTGVFHPIDVADSAGGFRVHFNGSFLPTHGVEVILHAAARLAHYPQIHFELVGDGQTFDACVKLAQRLRLDNVAFPGRVPIKRLPEMMAQSDLCLGAFGDDVKHRRLFILKVGQAMACRRAVVTGDTPAVRAAVRANEDLLVVPLNDARALADAIYHMWRDPDTRTRIAANGYRTIEAGFTPEKTGQAWLVEIERARQCR